MKIKCPYCKERIRKDAVRCKHCHSIIGTAIPVNDDSYKYLQNGFAKINSECESIKVKIQMCTGLIFVTHRYSIEELLEAINKIESFIDKMRADLGEWESVGKLSLQVKLIFNNKAGEVYKKLESLQLEITRREPTWWEKVQIVFRRIIEKLFTFFSYKLVTGKDKQKAITA